MIYKLSISLVIVCVAGLFIAAHFSSPPKNLGMTGGKLSPCPDSPNCVSSQESSNKHGILPINASGTNSQVMQKLEVCIEKMGGTVISQNGPYLHAEFRSNLFRFVDDLECVYNEVDERIEIRSASRLGYSDLGANRKRAEKLRNLFDN
ncbi:DUF1499 domain-containing protein [Maridesulfovibrio sp.]|uniref:DUF1499 domain-containing protein n=1 Tax=Maridesulfovibrio sp. TaxID=2795000 RepID=UPI003AFF7FFF